jgi:hypothetical protein
MSIQADAVNLVATARHAVEHNIVVDSTRNSYINRLIHTLYFDGFCWKIFCLSMLA